MIELKTEYVFGTNELTGEPTKGFMIAMSRNGVWKNYSHDLEDINFDDYRSLSMLFEISIKMLLSYHFNVHPIYLNIDEMKETKTSPLDKEINKLLKKLDMNLNQMEKSLKIIKRKAND